MNPDERLSVPEGMKAVAHHTKIVRGVVGISAFESKRPRRAALIEAAEAASESNAKAVRHLQDMMPAIEHAKYHVPESARRVERKMNHFVLGNMRAIDLLYDLADAASSPWYRRGKRIDAVRERIDEALFDLPH